MAKKIIKAKLDKKPSIAPFTNALRSSTAEKTNKKKEVFKVAITCLKTYP